MKDELLIEKYTLLNAVKYKGKAELKSTLGAIIQLNPTEFKTRIPEIRSIIEKMIKIVNGMTIEEQRARLGEIDPTSLKEEPKQKKEIKIDLPNLERFGKVVLRLAPYPSGPLHLGNSRMVVLNDYCAKKYKGELLLVFDDTIGSATKIIDPEAYDSIPEGLDFLGVKVHKTVYKSDRLNLFYKYAKDIILKKRAYICTCDGKTWRESYKVLKTNCPCRDLSIEDNIIKWEKMLDGTYPEQGAVVRLITSMEEPDPAIRDPVMLRIAEREHPRVGTKYRVWPLLEFSWGIDDHELGISHIIRGKDLRKEGILEQRIWEIYNWTEPSIILYGRMKLKGLKLSKSKSAQLIREKIYQDWTDPRTWSLQSLNRRGINSEAIRETLLAFGISPVDVTFSPEQIYSANRPIIDASANRFFMVVDPVNTIVKNVPDDIGVSYPLIHPEFPTRGTRKIKIDLKDDRTSLLVPKEDIEEIGLNKVVRLKDLMNIVVKSYDRGKYPAGIAMYHSKDVLEARKLQARMIQWTPQHSKIPIEILMPNGEIVEGVAEEGLRNAELGQIIQFERFAFCRVEEIGRTIKLIWVHK
jgi:glutamyl-tRNA synthetase